MSISDLKWSLPGWKIEQKYSSGVLIGNWSENRHKFERGREIGNSTSREVFRPYCMTKYAPDCMTRRRGVLRNEGLGKDQLFTHHGTLYSNNAISLYDQTFGRRYTLGRRNWDGKKMAWTPEIMDHPLQGKPTNFGLKQELEEKWKKQKELESIGDFHTTTELSYKAPSTDTLAQVNRKATDKSISCRLHPLSINRDLRLRNMHQTLFKEIIDPSLIDKS